MNNRPAWCVGCSPSIFLNTKFKTMEQDKLIFVYDSYYSDSGNIEAIPLKDFTLQFRDMYIKGEIYRVYYSLTGEVVAADWYGFVHAKILDREI